VEEMPATAPTTSHPVIVMVLRMEVVHMVDNPLKVNSVLAQEVQGAEVG